MRVVTITVLAVTVSGCGGSFDRSVCQPVPEAVVRRLTPELTAGEGAMLRNAYAVAMNREWHLVSAEVDGPGLDGDGHIATWAVSRMSEPGGTIYSVPEQATVLSRWPDASTSELGVTPATPEVRISQQCVRTASER